MKKISTVLFCLLIYSGLSAQNINGRLSSSIYSFERFDTTDDSNSHIRAFQNLSLNINKDKFAIRTSISFENDLSYGLSQDPRLRFYNLYLEGRNIANLFTIKLGRQPIFNSIGVGLFDGGSLDIKRGNYKLSAFYGGNVPAYQKFEIINNWNENQILGGRFTAEPVDELQLSLGYVRKNFKPQDYWALRLDEEFNPINVLIQSKSNQFEFITGEAGYKMEGIFSLNTRYDYDLNFDQTSRFEVFGEYENFRNIRLNAYYNYREPRISYNSIFSVFDYGNTHEFEIGADYIFNKFITFIGKFGQISYRDDQSQRVTIGAITNFGTLTYRKNLGYAGELDAISVYSAYTFLEGLLTPSVGLSFTNYKLSEDAEKNNLTSILAGVNYRPIRELSFDLQGQYMNNKIYKNDFRIFIRANYWFNNNLNIF